MQGRAFKLGSSWFNRPRGGFIALVGPELCDIDADLIQAWPFHRARHLLRPVQRGPAVVQILGSMKPGAQVSPREVHATDVSL